MTFKDEVRSTYGTDLNDVLVNIPDQATEIIDQLINMFSLKLSSIPPAYMRIIIFNNNKGSLFLDRYYISLNIDGTYGYRVKYAIRIVDYMPHEGVTTPKVLFYTIAEDFNIFYDKLSKFIGVFALHLYYRHLTALVKWILEQNYFYITTHLLPK